MDWAHERTRLLPKSGVGVVSHWLVIAPPGNPVIRIDLRALDEIWQADRSESEDVDDDASDHDSDSDDGPSVEGARSTAMLVLGDLWVGLYIADGPEAVGRIVDEAAPHVREATGSRSPTEAGQLLIIGNDAVRQVGELIQIGDLTFRISEVREYALRGANIPLTGGRLLQAAMAMLVVAAAERDEAAPT
jgi:hypothetical protein